MPFSFQFFGERGWVIKPHQPAKVSTCLLWGPLMTWPCSRGGFYSLGLFKDACPREQVRKETMTEPTPREPLIFERKGAEKGRKEETEF